MTDSPVFDTPMGPRALGRNTPATVAHWDKLVASMPVAPRIFRDAGQAVPTKSPDIRRFHYDSFLDQRQKGYCHPAGTLIEMADGSERAIESIAAGDSVLSHRNNPCKVIGAQVRSYTGPLTTVRVAGSERPISMTADHPVLVENKDGSLGWVAARQVVRADKILMPYCVRPAEPRTLDVAEAVESFGWKWTERDGFIFVSGSPKGVRRHVAIDANLARLMGLYLAEGGIDRAISGRPVEANWSYSIDEDMLHAETVALLAEVFGVDARIKRGSPHPTAATVTCYSSAVAAFFKHFVPGDTYSKRIPPAFLRSPETCRLSLVRGWMDGDGHRKPMAAGRSFQVQGTSASAGLRRDMFRVMVSCGIKPGMAVRKRVKHQTVSSGDVYAYGKDALRLFPESRAEFVRSGKATDRGTRYKRSGDGFLCPVKSAETLWVVGLPVYNFEVEGDHSYVANGIASHNCVGFNSCATVMTRLRIPADATETTGTPLPEIKLSPLYMYDISRMEAAAEGINLGRGDGSIGSCAGRGSMKYGVCDWDDDPADAASVDSHRNDATPPANAQSFGKLHLVKAMALADSFDHGKELVAAGIPASICSDIPSGMMQTDAKGFFRMRGGVVGGHDYQWIDFDESLDLAWIGQCWSNWGERSSDPRYAQRGGYTQVGTCPLSELETWYRPNAMANGSSEIIVYNTVDGFAPTMLDLGSWAP